MLLIVVILLTICQRRQNDEQSPLENAGDTKIMSTNRRKTLSEGRTHGKGIHTMNKLNKLHVRVVCSACSIIPPCCVIFSCYLSGTEITSMCNSGVKPHGTRTTSLVGRRGERRTMLAKYQQHSSGSETDELQNSCFPNKKVR